MYALQRIRDKRHFVRKNLDDKPEINESNRWYTANPANIARFPTKEKAEAFAKSILKSYDGSNGHSVWLKHFEVVEV